jgi:outer membrane protein TolC
MFSFLEVLDAQRALFEVKEQLNASLREFHVRQAALAKLTGQAPVAGGGAP